MSNVTIPQLPAAGTLTGTELYVLSQGGIMSSVSGSLLEAWIQSIIAGVPAGTLIHYSTGNVPAGYLACPVAQTNLSRTTYSTLFAALVIPNACTLTIASPGVVNLANHGRSAGDQVYFSTTGTLPTGLTAGTQYFIAASPAPTSGTFSVSATSGGTAINFTGSQTGIQTVTYAPWGIGDGSTTFGMPWFPSDYTLVQANGGTGAQTVGQVIGHTHGYYTYDQPGIGNAGGGGARVDASVSQTLTQTPVGASANFAAGTQTLICVKY